MEFPVVYKDETVGQHFVDLLVADNAIVEIKAVERIDPVFDAQLLSYLQIAKKSVGLLINFNTRLLKDGITRRVLAYSP